MPNLSDDQLESIRGQIRAEELIEAIKLYRTYTGAGLAEAKAAVEQIAAGENPQFGAMSSSGVSSAQLESVIAEFKANGKIQAIRLYRELTGTGLAEAKTAVERIAAERGIVAPGK